MGRRRGAWGRHGHIRKLRGTTFLAQTFTHLRHVCDSLCWYLGSPASKISTLTFLHLLQGIALPEQEVRIKQENIGISASTYYIHCPPVPPQNNGSVKPKKLPVAMEVARMYLVGSRHGTSYRNSFSKQSPIYDPFHLESRITFLDNSNTS